MSHRTAHIESSTSISRIFKRTPTPSVIREANRTFGKFGQGRPASEENSYLKLLLAATFGISAAVFVYNFL